MSRNNRLTAIEKLINEYEIDTQEELTSKLIKLGFNVSQSTVSRDINELKLIKVEANSLSVDTPKDLDKVIMVMKEKNIK